MSAAKRWRREAQLSNNRRAAPGSLGRGDEVFRRGGAKLKRSPNPPRKSPLRRSTGETKTTIRPKKCKGCREPFFPVSSWQTHCRAEACALAAAEIAAKKRRKAEDAERKERLKTRSDYLKEAQRAFNLYIRLRDSGRGCICCGAPLQSGGVGGGFDAGHYRSVGSAPHLRFDERNCHGQTKRCNRWGAGRAVDYRIGLVRRIGREAVEALEADQEPRHWTIEQLIAIRETYRTKLTAMRAAMQSPSPASGAYLGACILD